MGHHNTVIGKTDFLASNNMAAIAPKLTHDWNDFSKINVDERQLSKNLVMSAVRNDPSYRLFDSLRTRVIQALRNNNWSRIGITSPTDGCGKTFVSTNLAFSLARCISSKILLMDMNLGKTDIAKALGAPGRTSMFDYLSGNIAPIDFFNRITPNLLVGLNGRPTEDAAELLQCFKAATTFELMENRLEPDVTIMDLPSVLETDKALACLPHLDAVILVVNGTKTTDAQIREAETMLEGHAPLLGVVLNHSAP